MSRILIVEDDTQLNKMLCEAIAQGGYVIDSVITGEEGESLALTCPYDAILLDIMLPGKDGIEVCKSLRNQNISSPILMLTGKKENEDIIRGMDTGADDYLIKPFYIGVLLTRIRALIRRDRHIINSRVKINDLEMDTINRRIWKTGREVELTAKEWAIFEYLAGHPDILVSRRILEQHVWNLDADISTYPLDVHIKNLRIKLGEENRNLIQTIRGSGYRFEMRSQKYQQSASEA